MDKNNKIKKLAHSSDMERLIVTKWKIKQKKEYIDLFKQENKNTLV